MSEETEQSRDSHPLLSHVVQAGGTAADMATDIAAIAAVAWMATSGVDPATLQVTGAMVTSVAVGKRWMAAKGGPDGQ